jgi:divalent metal cation (Fe/Co/Zn/Cd) transporter
VFIEFHLLFLEDLNLGKAHEIASEIEHRLKTSLKMDSEIVSHLELKKQHDEVHRKYGLPI